MVLGGFVSGFGWFWVVLGGFGSFWVVLGGFGWFRVLVTTPQTCKVVHFSIFNIALLERDLLPFGEYWITGHTVISNITSDLSVCKVKCF